ncbi:MAG: carbohydrate ABC transporter substrate-binding protein [Phycisphaerae bacterium]|nr:carbohydrate ABC transporter substrate-binding protein [Phycisphaerae bacterium]
MKYLFLAMLLVLLAATALTIWMSPDMQSEIPVLYWVTDPNPARGEQIALFHRWLIRNDHCDTYELNTPDDVKEFRRRRLTPPIQDAILKTQPQTRELWNREAERISLPLTVRVPKLELRVDSANRDFSKQIIQGVSGVGGDIMDMGDSDIPYFVAVGLLEDVTDAGLRLGFDPSHTWEPIGPVITVNDEQNRPRQYAFPCNVFTNTVWANRGTFRTYGQKPPPTRWSFEEFERIGKDFVRAANQGKPFPDVFFSSGTNLTEMHRSLGLSMFNETLTACTLNDPRYSKVLALMKQWVYQDRILPSQADVQSFAVAAGYGGGTLQLFNSGNYAMFRMGRYALIQLRVFNEEREKEGKPLLDLEVCEPPNGGFPNAQVGTRAACVYAGGKHKDLAVLFLAYLASREYNLQIVDDADSLPPNPKYADLEEYRHPSRFPNEWEIHQPWVDQMRIAVPLSYSPYILYRTASRLMNRQAELFMTDQISAAEAAVTTAKRIDEEIRRTLKEQPRLVPRYDQAVERQKKIDAMVKVWEEMDALRSMGKPIPRELQAKAKKIPLAMIDNVFYRVYYRKKGWAQ